MYRLGCCVSFTLPDFTLLRRGQIAPTATPMSYKSQVAKAMFRPNFGYECGALSEFNVGDQKQRAEPVILLLVFSLAAFGVIWSHISYIYIYRASGPPLYLTLMMNDDNDDSDIFE